ncbi:hypothetical protein NV63_06665 [Elizabethkingia anophelis]|nr:hypothetical protein NV63_06665 [Elizabethkingia anophelis]
MSRIESKELMEKRNAYFREYNSSDELLNYTDIDLATRKINDANLYFIKNKLCKITLHFSIDIFITKLVQYYNDIKTEINNKYYTSENDYINYTPPAYDSDDFEETHTYNIRKGLIEYATYWNFKSNTEYDDYIILKINKEVRIEITYQHGDLYREYIENKKQEW